MVWEVLHIPTLTYKQNVFVLSGLEAHTGLKNRTPNMPCLPGAIVSVAKSFSYKLRGSLIMNVRIKILHHVTAPHSSLKSRFKRINDWHAVTW